jgi:hypothetical protein
MHPKTKRRKSFFILRILTGERLFPFQHIQQHPSEAFSTPPLAGAPLLHKAVF